MSTRGQAAEDLAAEFLQQKGLRILARNARCPAGELDLVAEDKLTIVFIEVRLRSHTQFASAAESINTAKQRRLILAAQSWLQAAGRSYAQRPCRFDAVLLDALNQDHITWLRDAFSA